MKTVNIFIVVLVTALMLISCGGTKVKRVDPSQQIDLSGFWNDTDVRIVCEALIDDCLKSNRVAMALVDMDFKKPMVLVGNFRNESSEHINTAIISTTMETVIFNSGRLDFVAGGNVRDELRAERLDQQGNASEATAKRLANETGADFLLTGTVRSIVDRAGNQTVRTYFVSAEMTNIETNQRMWMATNSEIKKVVKSAKNKI